MRWPARRTVEKELACPGCGEVIARIAYRPWPGNLTLTSPDGHPIRPVRGSVLLPQAAEQGSPERLAYVERNLGELLYDLRCRRGHTVVTTVPRLVRAVRGTPGDRLRVP